MATSITEKIAKVLNQAENAGTEAEAATFLAKAQELSTLYSIDLAKVRHLTTAKERTTPVTRTITLGVKGTRGLSTLVTLASGIASANDVRINIAHNSTYVLAFGFEEDIDVVESLLASLTVQMAAAAAEYRKTDDWKQDTAWQAAKYVKRYEHDGYCQRPGGGYCQRNCDYSFDYVPGRERPVSWLSARLSFQEAFARRIDLRLATAKTEAEEAAERAEIAEALDGEPKSASAALVLVEKRDAVDEHYRKTSTARGSYRGGYGKAGGRAYTAGRAAGGSARIGSQASFGGARKAVSA